MDTNRSERPDCPEINPCQAQAGKELDELVHLHVMKQSAASEECLAYSSEDKQAKKVLSKLSARPAIKFTS
jgi:hypothetical protein